MPVFSKNTDIFLSRSQKKRTLRKKKGTSESLLGRQPALLRRKGRNGFLYCFPEKNITVQEVAVSKKKSLSRCTYTSLTQLVKIPRLDDTGKAPSKKKTYVTLRKRLRGPDPVWFGQEGGGADDNNWRGGANLLEGKFGRIGGHSPYDPIRDIGISLQSEVILTKRKRTSSHIFRGRLYSHHSNPKIIKDLLSSRFQKVKKRRSKEAYRPSSWEKEREGGGTPFILSFHRRKRDQAEKKGGIVMANEGGGGDSWKKKGSPPPRDRK